MMKFKLHVIIIANEPAERKSSAGEAAENTAARRICCMQKKSRSTYESVRCNNSPRF